MRAIAAIAANTFREAVRDRMLYLFVGFAVVLLVGSKLFGMLTVGDQTKIIKDLGLVSIEFFSMLIAVMMGLLLISREVDSRTVFNILAKPVRRWQFLLGKYLGLVAVVAVNLALMTLLLVAVVWLYQHEFDPMLLFAGAMTLVEMAVLAAFATLFAVLTRPILGSLMTLGVFVIGHMSEDLWLLTRQLRGAFARAVIAAAYYLVPNLERFNFHTEIVHKLPIPISAVLWALAYALLLIILALVLADLRFRRKDLL
jgi:ABC-type transport system involved in multi-copper enzyme maturation permease subunit